MDRLFTRLGQRIAQSPAKTLLATILLFVVLITGVSNMRMATGNETLVQSDNAVYLSNRAMEESFGGDSILVLFSDETGGNLLSLANLQKMWQLEQRFKYTDEVFSFVSPASIVNQMAEFQSSELKRQILTVSEGLVEMSARLVDLGQSLGSKEVPDPQAIAAKLAGINQLTAVFQELSAGQDQLTMGVGQIQTGLLSAADGLSAAAGQLGELSRLAGENQALKMKLQAIAENIQVSAQGIRTIGEKTSGIQTGTSNTAAALTKIGSQLATETGSLQSGLSAGIDPKMLREMAAGFLTMGEKLGTVAQGLQLIHAKSQMMVADIPGDQVELDQILYEADQQLRPVFADVVLDEQHSLMVIKLQGNLGDAQKDQVVKDVTAALSQSDFETVSYIVSGKPVLDAALRTEMKSNMMIMVGLAVAIMLVVLTIVFKVRWRMLSLGIVLVSVFATLGLMGIISVPITMVSMAVFPILIGLGIDYSIQFHNRYEEERSVKRTVGQIGKAVATAVLATVLGFASLYASPVPMIQDFGKMLTIGVIISFVGSVWLLMPILRLRDGSQQLASVGAGEPSPSEPQTNSWLERVLAATTKLVLKLAVPILILVVTLAVGGLLADSRVGVQTDIETFMPQDMAALADIHAIRDQVGSTDQLAIYLQDADVLSEANVAWLEQLTSQIDEQYGDIVVGVKSIDTLVSRLNAEEALSHAQYVDLIASLPKQQTKMFVNEARTEAVILLNIKHLATEQLQDFIADLKQDVQDTAMTVQITGKSVLDVEMVKGLTSGRVKMTTFGLALVFFALLLIYRNPFKALIPIFPVLLIVGMSSGVMYLLGIKYTPITATLGALVLGMGTEMTVMLLERYLEERAQGRDKQQSMTSTVTMIGKAIVASGLTTVGGFSVLMTSKFIILRDFGFMTVINISLALFSTFVILPPIIVLLDRFIVGKNVTRQE